MTTGLLPPQNSFAPDASWTRKIPPEKLLNCVAVAQRAFQQAEQKLREIDRKGIDRERVRVAAFFPRLLHQELDRGCRRYASFMGRKFREHGLDFRVEEALSADALELLIMGAQANDRIHGTFIFFPAPFDRTEDYFLRRVRPEKDIEGLTIENTGRMALNIKTFDEEQKYEGVVPCTARAILALLHHYDAIKAMFPKDLRQSGPAAVILNSSARIGIPLQSMLMRIGATTTICHVQTRREDIEHFLSAADIVVTAFPAQSEADLVRQVKKGAVVIDCSTDGNLHPDVVEQAAYISPCDNHLGQITTALALYNTALCVLWQHGRNE
ncbi:MAG: bifunctional 5,10-methylenetetrahydrofolate dehydrogenase/5,10-methenyltetrahydrofolate cyclohydrolase [Acidobacteriia bacterium]|nr:bifunctional 5,10-methylenetetrahydrofolate dehydrogenase/5,10-methenyltetrahydrofolate cyclohydrolase [Terriglobia bacterium]